MKFKKRIAFAVSLAFLASSALPCMPMGNAFGAGIAVNVSAAEAEAELSMCGENAFWTLEEGTLTISGTGAMNDFTDEDAPWSNAMVTELVIESGITEIGSNAFSSIAPASVNIPNTVTCIGDNAFFGCGADIYLASIPVHIGNDALTGNTVHYGDAEEFDCTLADFIGINNVTITDEDIKDVDITLSRYDGKDSSEYGLNAGDTLKIDVNQNGYTPQGKIFYGTNIGYMLYMPDTYNFTEGMQKYLSANPYFITDSTAKSVNVNVYEVTGPNTITRICTKTFTLDSQATDETFKNSLDGISTVMFAGQTKTVAQILAQAGIGHVNDCLTASGVKIAEGENVSVDSLTGEITADGVGTAVVSYNASVTDCLYHDAASSTGNKLTVYVTEMPEITATETSVSIKNIDGYEFFINGTQAGEKTADSTVFKGLEQGRSYTVFMKTTDGSGQTNFTVTPSGHKLSATVDRKDKSLATFSCVNKDCLDSTEIADYFVKLTVTDDSGCEALAQIEKSENLEGVEISELTYYDKDGNEVPANEVEPETYTVKAVISDSTKDVTIQNIVTFGEHSFTEGVCDICGANETVIENVDYETIYTYGDEIAQPTAENFSINGDPEQMVFTWFDTDGNVLEEMPVNAGSYSLLASVPAHTYEDVKYTSAKLWNDFTIEKITELSADDFTFTLPEDMMYSGEPKNAEVTPNIEGLGEVTVKYYDVEGNETEPVNAGVYGFAVDVAESENNEALTDITTEKWTLSIEKLDTLSAEDFVIEFPAEAIYDGEPKEAVVTSDIEGLGEITVRYYDTDGNEVQPIDKGTYTVKLDVAEGLNNLPVTDIASEDWSFSIGKAAASVITPPTAAEGLVYTGEAQEMILPGEALGGTILYSTTKSGTYSEEIPTVVNAGTHTVWYYVKGDGVNYSDSEKASVEVTVGQIPAVLDLAPEVNEDLVYTGSSIKLITPGESETGTLMYSLTQGAGYSSKIPTAVNAGTYTVWYYVEGDSPNYSDTEKASLEVTISKAEAIVRSAPTAKTKLVYNGTEQSLIAAGKAKGGNMVYSLAEDGAYLIVIPTAKNAGTYQVWYYVQSNDMNYVDSQKAFVEVEIAKAENEIKTYPTAIEGLVYDGETHALVTEGAGEYGTMMYALSEDGEYSAEIPTVTDAGTYTVWYYAQGDENYADTEKGSIEVTVQKVDGELDTAPAAVEGLIYSAKPQTLVKAGKTQTGTVMYALSEDGEYSAEIPTAVNAGTYTVWYYVQGDVNHFDTEKASVEVTIAKASITAETEPTAIEGLIYNGVAQELVTAGASSNGVMLYALSEDGEYSEEIPTGLNAGTYTVWYYVQGNDNYADNEKAFVEVTIAKAEGTLDTAPSVIEGLVYNGEAQELVTAGESETGIIMYALAEDGEYSEEIPTAVNAGTYTVWYYVQGDENHTDTEMASVEATVEKSAPVVNPVIEDKEYTVGDALPQLSLTEGDTKGVIAWTVQDAVLELGENILEWFFTPEDEENYIAVTGTAVVSANAVTTSETTASEATSSETTSDVTTSEVTTSEVITSETSDVTTSEITTSNTTASETTATSKTTASETTSTSKTTASQSTTVSNVATSETTTSSNVTTSQTTTQTSASTSFVTAVTKVVYIGDANEDGKVNVRDSALIANALAGGYSEALPFTADFTQDGVINVRDAAAIARVLASNEAKHWIQIIIKVYPKFN